MTEEKIVVYKAFTGKKFNVKEECLEYEQILIEKMAKMIKRECSLYDSCSKCRFADDRGDCPLSVDYRCPSNWEID